MSHDPSSVVVRRLRPHDLPAALRIQAENYPAFLRETDEAFGSRLHIAPTFCLAATLDGALVGYLLAHGWPRQSPPAVGAILPPKAPSEVLYIHDLAVGSAGRGLAIGERLVASALDTAVKVGISEAELIAVEGATRYWRKFGFSAATCSGAVAEKVASYGTDAQWMRRAIP